MREIIFDHLTTSVQKAVCYLSPPFKCKKVAVSARILISELTSSFERYYVYVIDTH